MAVNPNFTNANSKTPYATGGGGGGVVPGSTISTYQVYFSTTSNSGAYWPDPAAPNKFSLLTYVDWIGGGQGSILTASGPSQPVGIGATAILLGGAGGAPWGQITGTADGVTISGNDGTGHVTETWFEGHNGATTVRAVSTMTDSQKTYTLDFPAFLSTMASVYPEIVKPYN